MTEGWEEEREREGGEGEGKRVREIGRGREGRREEERYILRGVGHSSSCWGSWKLGSFCEEVGEGVCNWLRPSTVRTLSTLSRASKKGIRSSSSLSFGSSNHDVTGTCGKIGTEWEFNFWENIAKRVVLKKAVSCHREEVKITGQSINKCLYRFRWRFTCRKKTQTNLFIVHSCKRGNTPPPFEGPTQTGSTYVGSTVFMASIQG